MPRSNKSKGSKELGHITSLELAMGLEASSESDKPASLGEAGGRRPQLGWKPNLCYLCSGSGKYESEICHYCEGQGWGPQWFALTSEADEVLMGGAKGGGKTEAGTMNMIKGNPNAKDFAEDGTPLLVNQSYVHHPNYRGLVLRKNEEDLRAWKKIARKYYNLVGGEFVDGEFRFPSGAVIWTGHLQDADSYEKYQGMPELHRVFIEEANQIPEEELYLHILSCMRSTTPELETQMFLTCNWIGRGLSWLRDRFVYVKDKNGINIPPRKMIAVTVDLGDRKLKLTRVFIPAGPKDNPHLAPIYLARLKSLPDKLRRVYYDGDYNTLEGTYFEQFRAEGPLSGEPDHANHVIGPKNAKIRTLKQHNPAFIVKDYPRLQPWWPHAIGGDWGYAHESAFYGGCVNPDTKQLHIYQELVVSGVGTEDLGVRMAKKWLGMLNTIPSHALTLWFSRDAFIKRNDDDGIKSFVQLLQRGIGKIIGPDNVHIPDLELENMVEFHQPGAGSEFQRSYAEWEKEILNRQRVGISIRKCNSNRVLGFSYMRDMMNWEQPVDPIDMEKFDPDVWHKLNREYGAHEAQKYALRFQKNQGIFPRLQIWDCCERLIDAIPKAVHDERQPEDICKEHFPGMDSLDACRYLLLGLEENPDPAPFDVHKSEILTNFERRNPNATTQDLIWVNRYLEAEEQKYNQPDAVYMGRSSIRGRNAARRAWRNPRSVN